MPSSGSAGSNPAKRVRRWLPASVPCYLLAGLLAVQLGTPLIAQPANGIELQPATRQTLARIQEQWLQWVGAFYQNDETRAGAIAKELIATAEQLGMSRLPDLCAGALARAAASAREGNFERARWALAQAELFDPGRPEIEFAAAAVALRERSFLRALWHSLVALPHIRNHPSLARLAGARAAIWLGGVLVLAAGLFLVLQLLTKGARLWTDVSTAVAGLVPAAWAAGPLTLVALLWPLALPAGVLWLALYLSILVWGYGSLSERLAFGLGWLVLAVAPLAVATLERRLSVELQPPARALDDVASGRLAGHLFTDLEALHSVLPESVAVEHLLADVHRELGQWEDARSGYLRVIAAEADNTAAALALGAYYFRKGDFGRSIEYFNRAATSDPSSAEARYDMSLAYSEKYLFTESRQALTEARRLNEPRVAAWIQQQSPDKVVLANGGVARVAEIRAQLHAAHPGVKVGRRLLLRRLLSVPLALAAAILAISLHQVRRRRAGYAEPTADTPSLPRWLEALLLGLASARAGRGFAAAGGALALALIAALPLLESMTFVMPWRFDPGRLPIWAVTVALVLGVAAKRLFDWRREA